MHFTFQTWCIMFFGMEYKNINIIRFVNEILFFFGFMRMGRKVHDDVKSVVDKSTATPMEGVWGSSKGTKFKNKPHLVTPWNNIWSTMNLSADPCKINFHLFSIFAIHVLWLKQEIEPEISQRTPPHTHTTLFTFPQKNGNFNLKKVKSSIQTWKLSLKTQNIWRPEVKTISSFDYLFYSSYNQQNFFI